MKTLLYAWEYGGDLGHVSVFIPIAKALQRQGWTLFFVLPQAAANIDKVKELVEMHHFHVLHAPGSSNILSFSCSPNTHAQLVSQLGGFGDSSQLTFMLKSWLTIYDEVKPDVVVCDFALTAQLATRVANIPLAVIDLGFFVPDPDAALPKFDQVHNELCYHNRDQKIAFKSSFDHIDIPCEQKLLDTINKSLLLLGGEELEAFRQLYCADEMLWLTYPELSAFRHIDTQKFLGAVSTTSIISSSDSLSFQRTAINNRQNKRIFAYLKASQSTTISILQALTNAIYDDIIVYVSGADDALIKKYSRSYLHISSQPINTLELLKQADIVICHAGVGMITQSLLAGVPLLLAPFYTEQKLNALRVADYGAGAVIDTNASVQQVEKILLSLKENSCFTQAARAFKASHKPANIDLIGKRIIALADKAPTKKPALNLMPSPKQVCFKDFDVVFLSYDEPNADKHWQHLKKYVNNAVRVHGVRGFDAAHKAAADAARTERFILVDGDNKVDPSFFDLMTEVPLEYQHSVWQWCSVNSVTGLSYAFGGLKIWTKDIASTMQTHERCTAAKHGLKNDFWQHLGYQSFYPVYSSNFSNGSPYQAFRSGYREGAKITMGFNCAHGMKGIEYYANNPEIRRIFIWMSTGADIENGYWSMLGARLGFLSAFDANNDLDINDYEMFKDYWLALLSQLLSTQARKRIDNGFSLHSFSNQALYKKVMALGDKIRSEISKPLLLDMTPEQSESFKHALSDKSQKHYPIFTPIKGYRNVC